MQFAVIDGERYMAYPGMKAQCPSCDDVVIAKCGEIKQWHWAHTRNDCDPWAEGMTKWHIGWQERFPQDLREIVMRRDRETHRADVRLSSGKVIEFQYSSISTQEIGQREFFYRDMVWVFDVSDAYIDDRFNLRKRENYLTFRWKHPRTSIAYARCKVFLHYSPDSMLELRKMSKETPCGGWGYKITVDDFVNRHIERTKENA
jgi:hypothetical protein